MKQVSAIDQVIAIHDPEHTALLAGMADRKRTRQEVPLPITLVQLTRPRQSLRFSMRLESLFPQPTAQTGSPRSKGSPR